MTRKMLCFLTLTVLLCALVFQTAAASVAFTTNRQLPDAMAGVYYSARIKADPSAEISFKLEPGDYQEHNFPKGMTLDRTGLLYGTPQKAGTYKFVVKVTLEAAPADAVSVFTLRVNAFDEGGLKSGGTNANIIGSGNDSLVGVANAVNGGQVAMGGSSAFFTDKKGYLMESRAPFKSASRAYGAVEYASLDTLGDYLYYFHHYLAEKGKPGTPYYNIKQGITLQPGTKNRFVTRIVKDPIGRKGRATLVELKDKISSLSVTPEVVLYVQGNQLKRAALSSGNVSSLRAYAQSGEVAVDKAFPFNGYAYFQGKGDGRLYRMPMDGQVAQALTDQRVTAFTAARREGIPVLYFVDNSSQLFWMPLEGGSPTPVEGLRASALNADEQYLYFTNAVDQHKIYQMEPGSEVARPLCDTPAKNIYVFNDYLAFEQQGGSTLYILPRDGGQATKLGK